MREVEVIKIGDIIGNLSGKGAIEPIVMIITDGGDIVDYYIDIFLRNMKDELVERGVGIQKKFPKGKGIKGIEDSAPVVGQIYQLKDGWHTSKVDRILEYCVLVTMNSVYAIHSTQTFREKKLKDLGI